MWAQRKEENKLNAVELAKDMERLLRREPIFFADILRIYADLEYRDVLQGWSELRSTVDLQRDDEGRYLI